MSLPVADNEPRRVLLVIAGLPAGGAERQMSLLATRLDRDRYDPGILIFNDAAKVHYRQLFDRPPWFRALGLRGRPTPGKALAIVRGVARAVEDFRPDLVHSSLNVANHAVRVSAMLYGWRAPVITSVRNDFEQGYRAREKLLERALWRRSAHILCNSGAIRDQLRTALHIPEDRISTIENGIDDIFFAPEPAARPEGWPTGPVALTAGRFTAQKNQTALVEALATLHDADRLGGWSFVLLGEGPLHEALKARIETTRLGGRIVLHPPVHDMAALYRASDLLIAPSRFEGLSNVCLEAAASGLPVLAADGANAASLIAAGGGWALGEPMTDSLHRALALSAAQRRAAGERARRFVRDRYSAARMADATAALYDRLAGCRGEGAATP
jgi:glycosyltransferase involved in cell wall biosynthesis